MMSLIASMTTLTLLLGAGAAAPSSTADPAPQEDAPTAQASTTGAADAADATDKAPEALNDAVDEALSEAVDEAATKAQARAQDAPKDEDDAGDQDQEEDPSPERMAEQPASTDDQFERVRPTAKPLSSPPSSDGRRDMTVRGELGKGVTLATQGEDFALLIRGRIQLQSRSLWPMNHDEPIAQELMVRRMRLLLGGHALGRRVTYYIQMGFSDRDLEATKPVPLRDAFVTWHLSPYVNLRVGQMKVPFDRQRVLSSSQLQLVERAIMVNELNLDRDVGGQLYGSIDAAGLRYFVGVFGGDGRNRTNDDLGLLYVGKLQWMPLGLLSDSSESDVKRTPSPRLALTAAAAYNQGSARAQSTHGAVVPEGSFDTLHLSADAKLMWAGWSAHLEFLGRRNEERPGPPLPPQALRSGWGYLAQVGYMLNEQWEVAARASSLKPWPGQGSALRSLTELTLGLNWLIVGHDLKVQADYTTLLLPQDTLTHQLRVQTQLFF